MPEELSVNLQAPFATVRDRVVNTLAPIASEARPRLVRAFRQLAGHSHYN